MSKSMLGIIFSNMHDEELQELTLKRTFASVPFGGRYRLIDFALSNMYNSGITKVGVITKNNYQSLLDHLNSGKEWDLSHKREGLYILPPFGRSHSGIYKTRLEALSGILDFIKKSNNDYVIMTDCNVVCNMNLNDLLEYHIQKKADITVVYNSRKLDPANTGLFPVYKMNPDGRVEEMLINPEESGDYNAGLNVWVTGKDFLERIVTEAVSRGLSSWERDILQKNTNAYRIYGWRFYGYAGLVDSIRSYLTVNMDLLSPKVREELFYRHGHIYTKIRDEVPARYGEAASVSNSFVADGCIINGEVQDSILFRSVVIEKGTQIKNSIIMQGSKIGENVKLNFTIIDKDASIGSGRMLMGFETYPMFISKGSVI